MGANADRVVEPGFGGRIGRTAAESAPWWSPRDRERRPNFVVIVLDDVGYGQLGCYGSSIDTPAMDELARGGVRYANFHVPALCSPTRASLLTGRNHHAVGMGFLGAFDTGYPGYRAEITPAAATIAEMLHPAGYGTYAVGKWHLTPPRGMSPAGPFDQWPTQRGFDRYYGFLWGEDDQWAPEIWYDQHRVETPTDPDYHFSSDMVDRAAEFLDDHVTSRPDDPFLLYLAFGACHAPHQAPRAHIDRYRGAFDHGWDEERRRVLARQIETGVAPADARLASRNPGVPEWASLTEPERRLYARLQEAFAGFMTHTDEQVGRLVRHLAESGALEDTVIVLLSDNGASGEGGRNGTINEYRYFLGLEDSLDDALDAIDLIGGPETHNQYPAGWAQAGNTPFAYYKKFTHGGGVRAPFIVSTPASRADRPENGTGVVRHQFQHVIDVAPTLLELAGVEAPAVHHGVPQLAIHGRSMAGTMADPAAPPPRSVQYFETAGNRAVYADGWKAVVAHRPGRPFDEDRWELYDLTSDFAETRDLAAAEPERLAALVARWEEEAERYGVFPLDDRMGDRVAALDPASDRRRYVMRPGTRLLNHVVGPSFSERAFSIEATPEFGPGVEGVVLAYGRRAFGFSVFVRGGAPVADVNLAGRHVLLEAAEPPGPGQHALRFEVEPAGSGALASLRVDGAVVARQPLPCLIPGGIGTLSIQCGHNAPSPVSDAYRPPFAFTGELGEVVIDLAERAPDAFGAVVTAELGAQ